MEEEKINQITSQIINCSFTVANKLGAGFLEKVYENSLLIELRKNGLKAENQKPVNVYYDQTIVGEYFADIFVENEIIIELKAIKHLDDVHKSQLMNYLKASNKRFGLLINFGPPKIEIKRIINGYNWSQHQITETTVLIRSQYKELIEEL